MLVDRVAAKMMANGVYINAWMSHFVIAPPLIGSLSDRYAPNHVTDAASLRLAMLCLVPTGFWATAHLYLAARDITKDQQRARTFPY